MNPIRTLLLDAVGTLLRLREAPGLTYARFAKRQGLSAEPERVAAGFRQVWRTAGHPSYETAPNPEAREAVDRSWWRAIVGESLRLGGVDPSTSRFQACFDEIFAHFGTASPWQVYADAREVLPQLRGRFKVLVFSNFDRRLLQVMHELELSSLVDEVLFSSGLGACKPSALAFQRALQSAEARAPQTLHIGDDLETDGRGALGAGLRFYHIQRPRTDFHTLSAWLAQGGDLCR